MNSKSVKNWIMPIGVILILLAVVLATVFLLRGNTTVTDNKGATVKNMTLSCIASGIEYPFFRYDNSTNKETKITLLFNGDNFKSISLFHTLHYGDADSVKGSEAQNHAAMNISFGENNLDADALSATYSMQTNKLIFTLYADVTDFNNNTSKYFLARDYDNKTTINNLKKNYEDQGFNCTEESKQ